VANNSNKIGIKVTVEFPSVSQMKADLAEKWRGVKEGFVGKINVDVDKNSLNKMKSTIQKLLSEKTFEIKIDQNHAISSINKIDKELKQLDERIGKVREIKLQFNTKDLQKPFEEILMASKKVEEEQNKIAQNTKKQTSSLNEQIGAYDKIVRKFKEIDGKKALVQVKTEQTNDKGVKTTRTVNGSGVTEDQSENRLARLKEIQDIMKRIHQIDVQQITAEGEYNAILQKEKELQKEQLEMLKQQYAEKHKMNAMDDNGLKELARQQAVTKELKEQAQSEKLLSQEQKKIASDVSKIAQLENQRHAIKMKLVNAEQAEKESLRSQLTHYYNIQKAIEATFNAERKMSAEQERELGNLRNINQLELERSRAKKQQVEDDRRIAEAEKALAQEQREASRKVIADLQEIHKLRLKIAEIEGRRDAGGAYSQADKVKVESLQRELEIMSQIAREERQSLTNQGLITSATQKQLRTMSEINQAEQKRVQSVQNVIAQNDKVEAQYQQWMTAEKNIATLRRDLITAGMREREVIMEALHAEEQKANAIKNSLSAEEKLTAQRMKEIEQIKQASNAQLELNSRRSIARERDRSFNDTGGLVDPYTVYANARMGFEMMLEPMLKIDEAFTLVAKVANASDESLQRFKETSYDVASSLGVTADEYMKAVETWVTAGETFEKSQELAKVSQVGAFVGNITADDMVKYMSVPLKAFTEQGVKANDIINIMNNTANNNAIEMDDLGKAYMRSATTVKTAGVSFQELTGMITGAQEATRMGGERIGTAMKAISMNYNLIKSQVTPQQQTKFDFFKSIGIDLNSTKSLTDAVGKLHDKWGQLKDEQKNTAIYYLAGKEHANVLNGIISQWDTVIRAEKEAREQMGKGIDGSAYIEFSKQSDSLKFKLATLKSEWMKFMNALGDSKGLMSNLMGGLIKGLEIASNLAHNDSLMNMLKLLGAGIVGHASVNMVKRLFDTVATGAKGAMAGAGELLLAWKNVGRQIDSATTRVGAFTRAEEASALAGTRMGRRAGGGTGGTGGAGGSASRAGRAGGAQAGTGALMSMAGRGGIKGILGGGAKLAGKTALKAIPYVGEILMALDLMGVDVFGKIGDAIDKVTNKTKISTQEFDTMMKKFKGGNMYINGTVEKEQNGINSMKKQLEKGGAIDKKGNVKGELDKSEFLKFRDQFNSQAEDLGLKDKNGVKIRVDINDTKDILNKLKALQEELDKTKAKSVIKIVDKSGDLFGSSKSGIKTTIKDIGSLKAQLADAEQVTKNFAKTRDQYPVNSEDYKLWDGRVQSSKKHEEELTSQIKSSTSTYEAQAKAINENGTALLAQGESIGKADMSSKQLVTSLQTMLPAYAQMKQNVGELNDLQGKLNGSQEMSGEELRKLTALYPELDGVKLSTLNSDKQLREEISQHVGKLKEEQTEQMKTGEEALKASAKKIDGDSQAKASAQDQAGTRKTAEEMVQGAIDSTNGKTAETIRLTDGVTESANKIPPKKGVDVDISVPHLSWLDKISEWMSQPMSKLINVDFSVPDWVKKGHDFLQSGFGSSVAIGTGAPKASGATGISSASVGVGAVSSASVATGTTTPISDTGAVVDADTSSGDTSPPARVDENVWRYWNTEDRQSSLEDVMKDLERAITDAGEDQKALIGIYNRQIANENAQKANLQTYYSQKNSEIDSVLNQLSGYGFNVDTSNNAIYNLGHARDLQGDSASKANELLNKWHSINNDMSQINDKIKEIDSSIADLNKKKDLANIQIELDAWKDKLKWIDVLTQQIANSDSQFDLKLNLIGSGDKELALMMNEQAMDKAKKNLNDIMYEFNVMSQASIQHKETGEQLKQTLDSLGSSIKAQADNILKYRQAISDLEFDRVTQDVAKFNNELEKNIGKNDNNIQNLRDGLLSGTKLGDLYSSTDSTLDLSRDNAYEKLAKERITLEKQVDDALTAYAKKNIDRESGVANETLRIHSEMYKNLFTMKTDYVNGNNVNYTAISSQYGDLAGIAGIDTNYAETAKKLEKYFGDVEKKKAQLQKKYQDNLARETDSEKRKKLTNDYIISSFGIDIDYFKAQINGNNDAIKELQNELKNDALTDDDVQKRNDQIAEYEQSNIDAQNKIKDTIKTRYDFEFSLMDEIINKQSDMQSDLQTTYDLVTAIGTGSYSSKGALLTALFGSEQGKHDLIKKNIESLQSQMKKLDEGSFEWNTINEKLKEYNQQLNDSNQQLVQMNKNILANSFESTTKSIEKQLFDGKSHDAWSVHQQLWLSGLEKELALEKMYQRMADLGTTVNKEKLDLLDKQKEVSAFEMDYLNKQLDIIELQQKVDNINKQRTVQTLQKNANGGWDWSYTADATQVKQAQDDLKQAQIELKQMEDKAKEDYLSQLEKIMQDAQNGQYDNVNDFKDAIKDLGEAFKGIISKYPELGANIDELGKEYAKYLDDNNSIIKGTPADAYLVTATKTMTDELKNTFIDISSQLGEIFANVITAKLPNTSVNATKATSSANTAISISKLEFPNVTDGKGLQDAILGLPQLALQKAKSKN